MDMQQLQYFQMVANLQHMTRAARELNITQPALSTSLARLEKELDLQLFDRSGRQVVLNDNGRLFLNYVNRILNEYEEAIGAMDRQKNYLNSTVSLLISGSGFPKNIIKGFCQKHPEINIRQQLIYSEHFHPKIFTPTTSFLLTAYPFTFKDFENILVYEEALYIAVSEEHPFSTYSSIALEELKDEVFIGLPKGHIFRNLCDGFCKRAGFTPNVMIECYPSQFSDLLEHTDNVAFTIESAVGNKEFSENIHLIPLSTPYCTRVISLVYPKGRNLTEAEKMFLQYCREYKTLVKK